MDTHRARRAEARRVCLGPTDARHCACRCVQEPTSDGYPSSQRARDAGGVALKLGDGYPSSEALRGAIQAALSSCNGNPLVNVRTSARHADGRLGGLWNRHCLKRNKTRLWPRWFYSKLNRNQLIFSTLLSLFLFPAFTSVWWSD